MPIYSAGSALSVEAHLQQFKDASAEMMKDARGRCTRLAKVMSAERKRLRAMADASPERSMPAAQVKRQDKFVGSVKYNADAIRRTLERLQLELEQHSVRALRELELERSRMMVEREQREKTSMTWMHAGGIVTTPHQKRTSVEAARRESEARLVYSLSGETH